MTKTHIYTALLMGSRFLFIDGHSLNFTTDKNKAHGKKSRHEKLSRIRHLIKKSPRLSVRGNFYLI